jgi:hypothetical protein
VKNQSNAGVKNVQKFPPKAYRIPKKKRDFFEKNAKVHDIFIETKKRNFRDFFH